MTGDDDPHPWRHPPTQTRTAYCPHGAHPCAGNPTSGLPPCAADEHRYCPHGIDQKRTTKDHDPRCAYCRGVSARKKNPDTYSPHMPRRAPE